jgi:hypothetical protein
MPALRDLVQAELTKREDTDAMRPALRFTIYDGRPDTLTDVAAAVKAVENGDRGVVHVSKAIAASVTAALEAKYPRRLILIDQIVEASTRCAPVPQADETAAPSASIETGGPSPSAEDAVQRAAERLVRLRGL